MRTKLFGKSNATLTEIGGETICIISCDKDEEIVAKVKKALKEHHIVDGEIIIDNEDFWKFSLDAFVDLKNTY